MNQNVEGSNSARLTNKNPANPSKSRECGVFDFWYSGAELRIIAFDWSLYWQQKSPAVLKMHGGGSLLLIGYTASMLGGLITGCAAAASTALAAFAASTF